MVVGYAKLYIISIPGQKNKYYLHIDRQIIKKHIILITRYSKIRHFKLFVLAAVCSCIGVAVCCRHEAVMWSFSSGFASPKRLSYTAWSIICLSIS